MRLRGGLGVARLHRLVDALSFCQTRGVAESTAPVRMQHALVPLPSRPSAPALYRIPFLLTLLGLFLVSVQAGQPLVGAMVMGTALLSTGLLAWRQLTRRHAPALALRERGDKEVQGGQYAAARSSYEQSLALALRELPGSAPEILLTYYNLAAVHAALHEHERAAQYIDRLFRGLNYRVPPAWAGQVASLLRRIGHRHSLEGEHVRALELCNRALELVGDAPGADDHCVRSLRDDLGWVHYYAGEYAVAESAFRDALALHEQYRDIVLELAQRPSRRVVGSESPYRAPSPAAATTSGGMEEAVAHSLLGLAWSRYERGDYDEAHDAFERAQMLATSMRTGPGLLVEILRGRAAVDMTRGDYPSAAAGYAQARGLLLEHRDVTQAASLAADLGWLARSCGRYAEAEHAYTEASTLLGGRRAGAVAQRCGLHESWAELRRCQRRIREAHREVTQALGLSEACFGPEHPRRVTLLAVASRIHTARSEYAEAERCARASLRIARASLRARHPRFAFGYTALGEVHLARGQFGAAEQAFLEATELREAAFGPHHPELVDGLEGLAAVLRATGREERGAEVRQRAEAVRDKIQGTSARDPAPRSSTA